MDGPPEIVDGMVMKVITSISIRPAMRASMVPTDWIPSWEFPAMRMTLLLMELGLLIGLQAIYGIARTAVKLASEILIWLKSAAFLKM